MANPIVAFANVLNGIQEVHTILIVLEDRFFLVAAELLRVRSILFTFCSIHTKFCSHMWSGREGDQQLNAECIRTSRLEKVPRLIIALVPSLSINTV